MSFHLVCGVMGSECKTDTINSPSDRLKGDRLKVGGQGRHREDGTSVSSLFARNVVFLKKRISVCMCVYVCV